MRHGHPGMIAASPAATACSRTPGTILALTLPNNLAGRPAVVGRVAQSSRLCLQTPGCHLCHVCDGRLLARPHACTPPPVPACLHHRENAVLHERLHLLDPGGPGACRRPSSGPSYAAGAGGGASEGSGRGRVADAGLGGAGHGMQQRGVSSSSSSHHPLLSTSSPSSFSSSSGGAGGASRTPPRRAESAGRAGPAARAAAAAVASNPFLPREVVAALTPATAQQQPLSHAVGAASTSGGLRGTPPATGRSASGTMTVGQMRAMLGSSGDGSSRPPQVAAPEAWGPAAAAAAGPASWAGLVPPDRLSEVHHTVTSRSLAGSVRLSTTGRVLPSTSARMAATATAAAGAGAPSSAAYPDWQASGTGGNGLQLARERGCWGAGCV